MDEIGDVSNAPHYGDAPQYPIESVDNALKVLLLLAQRPTLRMTEVSRYLGVASSSAHRLLSMLQYRGFLRQDPDTRAYLAGPALDDLAFGVIGQLDVRVQALPVLGRLNAALQETVHLGRLEGPHVHFIAAIESAQALRVGSRLGRIMPAHTTSTGKALLATLPDAEVLALYPDERLMQTTPHTIATRSQLLTTIAEVRRRGWAASSEESERGVASVAVALPGDAFPRLALNASVPRSRMNPSTQKLIREALGAAVAELHGAMPRAPLGARG
jgi:DNA-binding IclR family transcriptional regulator